MRNIFIDFNPVIKIATRIAATQLSPLYCQPSAIPPQLRHVSPIPLIVKMIQANGPYGSATITNGLIFLARCSWWQPVWKYECIKKVLKLKINIRLKEHTRFCG
jgi:hypothetical protein